MVKEPSPHHILRQLDITGEPYSVVITMINSYEYRADVLSYNSEWIQLTDENATYFLQWRHVMKFAVELA